MSYIDGVVAAVPTVNKQAYLDHAKAAVTVFKRHGALSMVECWGDDIPEGKINSLHTAVQRKDDETVVFSWIVWPSKTVRDEGWEKIMTDPDMVDNEMPFDGSRMIFGGFDVLLEA
ncbi:DUF1428 domain-containing protein [Algimonas porphyrae]|uniref:DUF1428 domain-containing protein n=1 Tax=Algimonas porphyrae TaxID=1128113 RepID=A0ABQ5V147_9PROT|nr:DUF1428 domain-containing protein [Algimonas porphyrae]GLQ21270.1 hypothetical protein GCM10007854_22250 [Algimonas porphyrae]